MQRDCIPIRQCGEQLHRVTLSESARSSAARSTTRQRVRDDTDFMSALASFYSDQELLDRLAC